MLEFKETIKSNTKKLKILNNKTRQIKVDENNETIKNIQTSHVKKLRKFLECIFRKKENRENREVLGTLEVSKAEVI